MSRILILSTYTIKTIQGGGQKRVAAIIDQYKRAGHDVKHTAIYMNSSYVDAYKSDIAIPWEKYNKNPLVYAIGDLLLSNSLDDDSEARSRFVKLVKDFQPDIVEIEQTFLYKTIKGALGSINWQGKLVNSTHNIEAPLKRRILESTTNLGESQVSEILNQIDDLEKFAARDANWSIACTELDAKTLRSFGATDIVLAPNGISREPVDMNEVSRLRKRYARSGVEKIILYVGSAHAPNLTGYKELVGGRLGFLDKDTKLVAVGGIADLILNYANNELPTYIKPLFFDKVELLGMVEENTLTALLHIADEIILPIMDGGGSNLKTAEAILADKKVVATTKSLNSYEAYIKLPNMIIADDSDGFIGGMAQLLRIKKKLRTESEKKLAEGVLWKNTLKLMVERANNG